MKPRSGVERRFVDLANSMPPYSRADELLEWTKRTLFRPKSFYWRHRGRDCEMWCLCCGHREPAEDSPLVLTATGWTCPECGARTEVLSCASTKDPVFNDYEIVTAIDVVDGVQVLRTFEVRRFNAVDVRTGYRVSEVFQNWILDSGREVITTRGYSRGVSYFNWDYSAPYSIGVHRKEGGGYYVFEDVYRVSGCDFFPKMRFAKYMRQAGMDRRTVKAMREKGADLSRGMAYMLKNPYVESLLKTGYERLYWHLLETRADFGRYRHAVNICHRNRYPIDQPGEWLDYMDNLIELGLDTHNAHYVCPADLNGAHTRAVDRVMRLREKRRMEEMIREAEREEGPFRRRRGRFFGLSLKGDGFTVVCIRSVMETMREGRYMHHCVFTNGYYKNTSSLLLSARDDETGKPVETVEVSLRTFEILQCRGRFNRDSDRHAEIVDLVNGSMDQIRNLATRKNSTTKNSLA